MTVPRLLTYAEASVYLGCSVKTVRRRVDAGQLVPVIDGGLRRITETDLRAYIDSRRRAPTGPKPTSRRKGTRDARAVVTPPSNPHPGRVRRLWETGDPDA